MEYCAITMDVTNNGKLVSLKLLVLPVRKDFGKGFTEAGPFP